MLPSCQGWTEEVVNIPDHKREERRSRNECDQGPQLVSLNLFFDPETNNLPYSSGYRDGHAKEKHHVQDELICETMINDKRDYDAKDDRRVATLDGQRFSKCVNLQKNCSNGYMH